MIELMLKNTPRIIFVFSVVISHLVVLYIPSGQAQKGPPATPVKVAQVSKIDIAPQVQLIGTAQPKLTSVVASDIEGLVDIENPWTFTINEDVIIVQVTVRSGQRGIVSG